METTKLLSIQTPKGTVRHLVAEGEQYTLCGRHHGTNPRHVTAQFEGVDDVRSADEATCEKCQKVRAGE
jgi:hypothetical protein